MQKSAENAPNLLERLTGFLPLLWISLSFLAGILLASLIHNARSFWIALLTPLLPKFIPFSRLDWVILAGLAALCGLILLIVFILFGRTRRVHFHLASSAPMLVLLCVVALLLGAVRFAYSIPYVDANYISWYNDRDYEVLVTGTVIAPPDERDSYTNLRIDSSAINTGDQTLPVHGLFLARVGSGKDWHYGDVVRVRGHLKTPPSGEDFSYQDYLSHQGIYAYLPDGEATLLPFTAGSPLLRLIYSFRDKGVARIYQIFPDPEASLLAGILLGDDNGLPAALQQAYQNTGTAHIIAISGFNIAIIAGLFVGLFSRLFGRRRGALAAVVGIVLYSVLVGATASVVRAAIMGSLAIFAGLLGRRQNGLNTLAFTAGIMAAFNPQILWDVGFQLSFAATLGLVLYAQPLTDWTIRVLSRLTSPERAEKIGGPLSEALFFTLAAQLTTLPIMAYQFRRLSLVAVIANPLILPVQPAVMVLAGLALLLSFIYLPLGKLAAWLAWPFAAYTDRMVEFFNRIPHGVIVLGEFSLIFVLAFYIILLGLTFAGPDLRKRMSPVLVPSTYIAIVGIGAYLVWTAAFAAPDGRLHVTFLDVGSSDAVLIQTPSGRTILVNGGGSASALSEGLGTRLPLLDRQIDWLVVASPQEQEMAALPTVLDRFPVSGVLWSGNMDASYSAADLASWLTDHSIPITLAYPGAVLDLGQGAQLKTLAVSPSGSVLLVEWQGFRLLLPVGLDLDDLTALDNGKQVGPVTALLLTGSGAAQFNPPAWVTSLQPKLAVLSVAAGDSNGLPDPGVVNELSGIRLVRTDQNGWIDLSTDGSALWVEVQKMNSK